MRQIITTSLTLIFLMLAGAASAGDCLRLCDDEFWKTQPTLSEVQSELNKGADLSASGLSDLTPLHYAAIFATPEHIQFLIKRGADLEAKTPSHKSSVTGKRTPLHYAARYTRNVENVITLIEAGANINARASSGYTPLMLAVRRQNAEAVNILLDAGANAQLRNRRKEIAFDYARGKPEWIDLLSTYKRLKAASGE